MSEINETYAEHALRQVVLHMDYDLYKSIENLYGEHDDDEFPYYAEMFVREYQKCADLEAEKNK